MNEREVCKYLLFLCLCGLEVAQHFFVCFVTADAYFGNNCSLSVILELALATFYPVLDGICVCVGGDIY